MNKNAEEKKTNSEYSVEFFKYTLKFGAREGTNYLLSQPSVSGTYINIRLRNVFEGVPG